jgi:hypothetical protein
MVDFLDDLLDDELTQDNIRVVVERIFDKEVGADRPRTEKDRTPKEAKPLVGVYDLIRQAIVNFEKRAGMPDANKVLFTEEEPDASALTEVITFSLVSRVPGSFGQGAPFESRTHNLRPMLREEVDDPENPGYRVATLGYWHDNIIRLTCWAQTNKAANARAEWLEKLLEEYAWFFKAEGVDRFLFHERNADIIEEISNNRWYGRPLDYFVRTETLRTVSEKTIEEIIIELVDPVAEY